MDDVDNFSLRARGVSDSESEEEGSEDKVDSYGSPFHTVDSSDSEGGIRDILWMPEGDMERAYKIAYAFVSEDGPIHSPAPFIHSAIFSVAPWVCFCMSPSSRGHMLLHLNSMAELDFVVGMCPISHARWRASVSGEVGGLLQPLHH